MQRALTITFLDMLYTLKEKNTCAFLRKEIEIRFLISVSRGYRD